MARMTLSNLPMSLALDYKAMTAIRGSGAGDWVLYAFTPYQRPSASVLPTINFYQTNYFATNLTLQNQNINVENSAPNANITVGAGQNALTMNLAPGVPST